MMKKRKRFKILFIVMIFMVTLLTGIVCMKDRKIPEVKAANNGVEAKIAGVLSKYPDGSYFSSTGGPCGPGQTNFGAGNYCTYCQLYVMDREACSVCGNGDSCNAFAKYVFYNVFGLNPRSCPSIECDNPNNVAKIGDFLTCYDASGKEVHYSIYMGSAGGNSFYAYEANVGKENLVKYKFLHSSNNGNLWPKYKVYHASNYDQIDDVSYNPDSSLDSITSEGGCIRVTGWSFDRDSLSSSVTIHVYMDDDIYVGSGVADKKRTDVNAVHGCGDYHGFDFTIPIKSSGTHTFKVFAINIGKDGQVSGQGNPLIGSKSVNVVADETSPVISDVKIVDLDSSGYTVECKVTDNQRVDRVQCPTWTVANGQDDIQQDWWTAPSAKATDIGNGVYQFRVNISDHNYEYGLYRTHIYAYDTSGNYALSVVDDIEIFEDRLQFYEGFGRGFCTMNGRDARVIEFDVVARDGDEGSKLTITTFTNVNGKDIIQNESFTVEETGRNVFYHLIDRSKYNNGDGDYTTTAVLENKDGKILESKKTIYNFTDYAGPYYVSLNIGDEIDIFEATGTTNSIKATSRFKDWLWPENCNICTGEIEYVSDDVYKGKKIGRVYASFCNISSATRTTVIIDVVDSKADTLVTEPPEQLATEQPTTEQPTTEQPTTEQPTAEPPTTEQPTAEPPTTEQPTVEPPTTEQLATEPPEQSVSTSNLKVKAFKAKAGKKKLSLSWDYNLRADGYQIQVSTKKNFSGAKKKSLSWIKSSYTFKNLKAKKKYYIRIRAYVNGQTKKVYGKWKVISKKTK